MFGKLLKHELKSVGKWYLGLYGLTLIASILLGFYIHTIDSRTNFTGDSEPILLILVIFSYATIIISVALSTLFLVINRFRKNIYGRQGYLTMTLPVTGHQLILSKLVAAFIWNMLAVLVIILSLVLMISVSSMGDVYSTMFDLSYISDVPALVQYGAGQVVDGINAILLIYFAISIGQLFQDHRNLMAFVAFFGIQFVVGTISSVVTYSLYQGGIYSSSPWVFNPVLIGGSLALSGLYYYGTYYIMTRKLNLQ